jgi:pimeloyl-ACP methyl ester carboxylesterase
MLKLSNEIRPEETQMNILPLIENRTTTVKGRRINYYISGRGEPLVVIHGGLGDASTWLNNIALLSAHNLVYAPDLPGFGRSQTLEGQYDIPRLADFVEDFTASLNLTRFNLMGHSIGGGVALSYALRFPQKVKKLVLISSLCLGEDIGLWIRILSMLARSLGATLKAAFKGLRWLVEKSLLPIQPVLPLNPASIDLGGNITSFKEQTLVLQNRLGDLLMPTLVVWGAKDNIVPVKQAYKAAESIRNCQLKVFENIGHDVHRQKIGEFSRMLMGFLELRAAA